MWTNTKKPLNIWQILNHRIRKDAELRSNACFPKKNKFINKARNGFSGSTHTCNFG